MLALTLRAPLALAAALLVAPLALAGCGDPLVVLGDAPGYMRVVAGIPDSIGTRTNAVATRSRFTDPGALAFDDAAALLYVADRGSTRTFQGITQRIARIMSVTSGGVLTLLLDGGGCAGAVCIFEPTAMTLAPDGSLLLADAVGHRIMRFHPGTKAVTVVAGTGTPGSAPDGTNALQAPLNAPSGVAVDDAGTIYFSEAGGHRVRRIDAGGALRTVAGTGVPTHSGDTGPAAAATLHTPTGLALHERVLYVSQAELPSVRAIDLGSGVITTVAGSRAAGFSGDEGPAVQARLAGPRGLTVSADGGTLYIADTPNHRVRAVNLANGLIRTFAGTGSPVFTGNRQPAGEASLRLPTDVWASGRGFLFIADAGHQVVWRAALTL